MKKTLLQKYLPLTIFLFLAFCLLAANPFSRAGNLMQDLLYQAPGKIISGLYILPSGGGTDEAELRQDAADTVAALNADPASAPAIIGIDLPLFGRSEDTADEALFAAVSGADNVVLPSQIHYDHQIIQERGRFILNGTSISSVQAPVPPLDTLPSGFTNMFLDGDGRVRHGLLWTKFEGHEYGHMAYVIYRRLTGNNDLPPLDKRHMWYVDFNGKPGAFDVGVTWQDVIAGTVPASSFQGAVVLLCAPSDSVERFRTPLGQESSTEITANMVQALVSGERKREVPFLLQLPLLLLLLAGFYFLNKKGLAVSIATLAGGVILWPLLCILLYYTAGLALAEPIYLPLLSIALFLYQLAYDWMCEMRERVRVRRTLRRYLSPETANRLLRNHVSLEKPEKRDIAVLFVDIRGFTPLSESLAPGQMADVLKEYLTLTSSAIFNNGGTLDKFIGDATMGFFNAPLEQDDYVYHAVKAAMEIAAGGERIRETFNKKYGRNIYFGLGVHFGSAVVGEIGPDYRKDYTAIGDTVNTASRLESNAKPGEVLVSLKVCEELEDRLKTTFVGERQIKGKSKTMMLYRVDSLDGVAPPAAPE